MSETQRRLLIWVGSSLFVGGVGLVAIAMLVSAFSFNCENEILKKVSSPDGKHVVYFFRRNCGATTGFAFHASVLPSGVALPNEGGNIPVCGSNISAEWVDGQQLKIAYQSSACELKETVVSRINVKYVAVP